MTTTPQVITYQHAYLPGQEITLCRGCADSGHYPARSERTAPRPGRCEGHGPHTYEHDGGLFVIGRRSGRSYRVTTRVVGQQFGRVGVLTSGRHTVAEGDTRPLNNHGACVRDAIELADER